MPLTAVDLFAGAGGLSAGLERAGIEVVEAYDNWPAALTAYQANLGGRAVEMDLSDTDRAVERIAGAAPILIAGSPPCRDFSSAGRRIEGQDADLTAAFGRIVRGCRPATFLMENVPQVRASAAYRRMLLDVERAGYSLVEMVLDACHFGVPQRRRRLFVFGHLGNSVAGIRYAARVEYWRSARPLSVKECLGDEIAVEHYYRHPLNYGCRAVFSVREPSPTVRGLNTAVPRNYVPHPGDAAPPEGVRALTARERSRIQTFPLDWEWPDDAPLRDTEKLIGNAVPVHLAAIVGNAVMESLDAPANAAAASEQADQIQAAVV